MALGKCVSTGRQRLLLDSMSCGEAGVILQEFSPVPDLYLLALQSWRSAWGHVMHAPCICQYSKARSCRPQIPSECTLRCDRCDLHAISILKNAVHDWHESYHQLMHITAVTYIFRSTLGTLYKAHLTATSSVRTLFLYTGSTQQCVSVQCRHLAGPLPPAMLC